MTSAALDSFLDRSRADVEARLRELFAAEKQAAGEISVASRELVEALEDFTLRGGKRIRAALVRIGFLAVTDAPDEPAQWAAAAMELIQSFLLAHDDIIDRDDLRRGAPSLHRALETWPAGARDVHLGRSAAILAGDLAAAWAARLVAAVPASAERVSRACQQLQQMVATVITGEALDVAGSAGTTLSRGDVLRLYQLKTASYTLIGPLRLGALLGGADDAQLSALTAVGRPLGVAFQILDDLLGLLGDFEQTGKPAGADLKEAKATLVLLEVRERASGEALAAFDACVGADVIDAAALARARDVANECGAVAACRALAAELTDEALSALERAPLREEGRALLAALARKLLDRAR